MALALAGNLGLNALTSLALWPFGRRLALAVGLVAGNRNQALFRAVMRAEPDPGLLLFFALSQVPMFLSALLPKPLYRRLLVTPPPACRPGHNPSKPHHPPAGSG